MTMFRSCGVPLALLCMTVALAAEGWAQSYPAKVVRYVVPMSPGSGADTIGRIVCGGLTQVFGQQVIVDNRTGAAGRPRAVNRVPACGMRTSASRDARRWI